MFPTRDSTSGVRVPTTIGGNAGNVSWTAIGTVSSSHASLSCCPSLPITEFIGSNNWSRAFHECCVIKCQTGDSMPSTEVQSRQHNYVLPEVFLYLDK